MVVTITSRSTKTEIEEALKKLEEVNKKAFAGKSAAFDAHKYCGILKLKKTHWNYKKNGEMSGTNYLLDTNIILYLLGGDKVLADILNTKSPYISYITEMDLLGSP